MAGHRHPNYKASPGNGGSRKSAALIERDIELYRRHMRGLSYRALCEEFSIKSPNTVMVAVARGKQHVKDRGIDIEDHRLEINQLFQETLVEAVQQMREQRASGVTTVMTDAEGNVMTKTTKGADVRLLGEIGRSATRWAEFLGLMDRAPDAAATQQTTVVLSAPTAGSAFEARYAEAAALEPSADQQTVEAVPVKSTVVSEGGPGWSSSAA